MIEEKAIRFTEEPTPQRIRELLDLYFEGFDVEITEGMLERGPGWMVTFSSLPKMRWSSGNEDLQKISVLMRAAHRGDRFTAWACCPNLALDALALGFVWFVHHHSPGSTVSGSKTV